MKTTVRVLMNADTVGGVWSYCVTLLRELAARGVELALVTAGRPLSREQRASLPRLHLVETSHALEWMPQPWQGVDAMGERLLAVASAFHPDVVHLNDYSHALLPWRAPVLVVAHSCVPSWFECVRGQLPGPEWQEYRLRVRSGLRAADLVVAPTRWMRACATRLHGPLHRTLVIANGHDAAATPRAVKGELILAAGRIWDEAKGLATLAEAAAELPWPVVLAGDTAAPDGTTMASLPNVRLTGRLSPEHLRRFFARASIFASPARYEPFGLAVLEAAVAGCALVLSDIESLREVWADAALYVEVGDAEAWTAALRRLIDDEAGRRRLQQAARERSRRFGATAMADAYLAAYALLASERERELPCAS